MLRFFSKANYSITKILSEDLALLKLQYIAQHHHIPNRLELPLDSYDKLKMELNEKHPFFKFEGFTVIKNGGGDKPSLSQDPGLQYISNCLYGVSK